jgi:hypothetical protein
MIRRTLILAAALVAVIISATSALGSWTATSAPGAATSKALSVPDVFNMSAVQDQSDVYLSWQVAPTPFPPGISDYLVTRYDGTRATIVPGCTTLTSCVDESPAPGAYSYWVSARYFAGHGSIWSSPLSAPVYVVVD